MRYVNWEVWNLGSESWNLGFAQEGWGDANETKWDRRGGSVYLMWCGWVIRRSAILITINMKGRASGSSISSLVIMGKKLPHEVPWLEVCSRLRSLSFDFWVPSNDEGWGRACFLLGEGRGFLRFSRITGSINSPHCKHRHVKISISPAS